jgi:hypothetical protein
MIAELPQLAKIEPPKPTNDLATILAFTRQFQKGVTFYEDTAVFFSGLQRVAQGGVGPSGTTPLPTTPAAPPASAPSGGSDPKGEKKSATPIPGAAPSTTTTDSAAKSAECLIYVETGDAVFNGYPIIRKQYEGCSLFQIKSILEQVPPGERHNLDVLRVVNLPGLGGLSGAASQVSSAGRDILKRNNSGLDIASAGGGSFRMSRAATMTGTTGAPVVAKLKPLPSNATGIDTVRYTIEVRERTRAVRAQAFKHHWEALKQGLH